MNTFYLVCMIVDMNLEVYGLTMIHADNQIDDDDFRVLSVIIALTDDYDGGIFNFPKQSYQVKLKKGEVYYFPTYSLLSS